MMSKTDASRATKVVTCADCGGLWNMMQDRCQAAVRDPKRGCPGGSQA